MNARTGRTFMAAARLGVGAIALLAVGAFRQPGLRGHDR